jgi:hypothetical protein
MDYISLADLARQLEIDTKALRIRLRRKGIKPVKRLGCRMRRRANGRPMHRESAWRWVVPTSALAQLEGGVAAPDSAGEPNGRQATNGEVPKRSRGRPTGIGLKTRDKRTAIREDIASNRFTAKEIAFRNHVSEGYVRNVRANVY